MLHKVRGFRPFRRSFIIVSPVEQTTPPHQSELGDKGVTPDNTTRAADRQSAQHEIVDLGEEGEAEKEDSDVWFEYNPFTRTVEWLHEAVREFFTDHSDAVWKTVGFVLLCAYSAYFVQAMLYKLDDEGSIRLLVMTVLGALYGVYKYLRHLHKRGVIHCPNFYILCMKCLKIERKFRLDLILAATWSTLAAVYVGMTVARTNPARLNCLSGLAVLMLIFYIFSYNPSKVHWRPVVWGVLLQFTFAVLILRTKWGYYVFAWLGDRVSEFLAFSDDGARFFFGDSYRKHFFAFRVLPIVVFFSTCVNIMYYLGVMQFIIGNVGRFLAFCLDTSAVESVNVAGNIFLGQSEAVLTIRPFIARMTKSELHSILSGGFATIAGSVMGAYIVFGVPATHLLSASVMSAPAALAMSKLFYPETEPTRHTKQEVYNMPKRPEMNIFEAASIGASQSIPVVASIAVNILAFVALIDYLNACLVWMGDRVGLHDPKLTFQLICAYTFYPMSVLLGIEEDDRLKLSAMLGTKTFVNEFRAYVELSKYINNRKIFDEYVKNFTLGLPTHPTGKWSHAHGGVYLEDINKLLPEGLISERSMVIATYSLCGFSNFASMGLMLGVLCSMAPERRHDFSAVMFRAMVTGNAACVMTACIAGLLFE